eukprot:m.45756 g.45756  ORF g.45756 m.45756 type:complete len:970 (-) comp10895_c0_seq1:2376-5285(-)
MKSAFQFSNLCGTVYKGGSLLFTPDGNSVISPVGNRVTVFDLVNNKSTTLPHQCHRDIDVLALSPNGLLLMAVDKGGQAILVNLHRHALLHRFNFKTRVRDLKFSPDGRYFAVTHGTQVHVWRAPGLERSFNPFSLVKKFTGHADDVTCLDWSFDSKLIVAGANDATCRVFTMEILPRYRPFVLGTHRERIIHAAFDKDSYTIYTVSRDGTLLKWSWFEKIIQLSAVDPRKRRGGAVKASEQQQSSDSSSDEEESAGHEESSEESDESEEESAKTARVDVDVDEGDTAKHVQSSSSEDEDVEESEDEEDGASAGRKRGPRFGRPRADVVHLPRWRTSGTDRHYFMQPNAKVTCALFHKSTSILVVGFTNGIFGLYELPDFNNIHTLSVSQKRISSVAMNPSGEWMALGAAKLGQLLVWEWQSETYVLKQQGHFFDMDVVKFSPEGHVLATGGGDGKVKLWHTSSGFCYVTFKEHQAAITDVVFAPNGLSVLSSSLDGTVRAFDMMRYRNFRTFTTPEPQQFSCMSIDPSGEIVAAGCLDVPEIFVWSMKNGQLLDTLAGHQGPISGCEFHPSLPMLLSSAWDGMLRVWDVFEGKPNREAMDMCADIVALAVRPDGKQFVVSTLKGSFSLWDFQHSKQLGEIDYRRDMRVGRKQTDLVTAKHLTQGHCYTAISYTADGSCLLAGGQSRFISLYQLEQQVLLRQFTISANLSIDGMQEKLNSKNDTSFGALALMDTDSDSDPEMRVNRSLPGVKKGDYSSRITPPEIRVKGIHMSSTGRSFAAATTEGLVVFSLDDTLVFDPFNLDIDITPDTIVKTLEDGDTLKAIVMAFRLSEQPLIHQTVEAVKAEDIKITVELLPTAYIKALLVFLAEIFGTTRHLEYYLTWCKEVLTTHGRFINAHSKELLPQLRNLQKAITSHRQVLVDLCRDNVHYADFFSIMASQTAESEVQGLSDLGDIAKVSTEEDGEVDA